MKLFIKMQDTDEVLFIPSFLIVENFEKLMRKKNHNYKEAILIHVLFFLLIDKKNKVEGFNVDFSVIEEKALESFNRNNKVDGKLITYDESNVSNLGSFSLPKDEFQELFEQHEIQKKRSGIISFEHVFKYDFSRNFFLFHAFVVDFEKKIRNQHKKDIEKYLIGNSTFYLDFYANVLKKSNWFENYKKKDIIYDWLAENVANFVIHKKEELTNVYTDDFVEILKNYFSNKGKKFPVADLEEQKLFIEKTNFFVNLTRDEKKEKNKFLDENYETKINERGLDALKLYIDLLEGKQNDELSLLIKKISTNILISNLTEETDFSEASQHLFEQECLIDIISSEDRLLKTETLVYLESRVKNKDFIMKLYQRLWELEKVNLKLILPLVGDRNNTLSKQIIKNSWLDLIKLVTDKFSEKSNTYSRVLTSVIDTISIDDLLSMLLVKKRTNFNLATKFLTFLKRKITKKEYKLVSEKIIESLNFNKFDDKRRNYFELIDGEVITSHFSNLDSKNLKDYLKEDGLLVNILEIENKSLIPKILAQMQLVDLRVFEELPNIISSKYFWSAYEFNLRDSDSVDRNSHLTKSDYFKSFLLKLEGIDWLKSETGSYWLSLPEAEDWKKSTDGIFIQNIVLNNQRFFIETQEVFDSYLNILQKTTNKKIDKSYLINNEPVTFDYLLKESPESILLIDYGTFDRHADLAKIIIDNPSQFLQSEDEVIVLNAIRCLLHERHYDFEDEVVKVLEANLDYFYNHNQEWFLDEKFCSFMKKYKPQEIYTELFEKTIDGFSKSTRIIVDNLIKVSESTYVDLLIKKGRVPYWVTGNVSFVEMIIKSSKDARSMVNLIGFEYFDSYIRKGASEDREWFTEFVNLFGFRNKKKLKPQLISSLNKDCKQNCTTRKTGKPKEGFRDFYDVFLAISFYSNSFNQVQRPYKCKFSKLWHKTSDWN